MENLFLHLYDRKILTLNGPDAHRLLQNISTNSIKKNELVYNSILTPKGVVISDFFVLYVDGGCLVDCYSNFVQEFCSLLNKYKLTMNVALNLENDFFVYSSSLPTQDEFCFIDPRNKNMGYRIFSLSDNKGMEQNNKNIMPYDIKRIKNFIPEVHKDILPYTSYPIHYGMDNLNAIDFKKGCFMGQEIVCVMKYRKKQYKKLCIVKSEKLPNLGDELFLNGNNIGVMGSSVEEIGLALIDISVIDENHNFIDNGVCIVSVAQ